MAGTLYLIPVPIAEDAAASTTNPEVLAVTRRLQHYVAEDARTARRMLRAWHPNLVLESIDIFQLEKHGTSDFSLLRRWLREGKEVGLMSEAGCPAVADPGSEAVGVAHAAGAQVKPLSGPSSILLALMASGLNGQSFAFWGYLPTKEPARGARIKELEQLSRRWRQTQIFIETPYRNDALLGELLKQLSGETVLCIAQQLSGAGERILSKTVAQWRKSPPGELGKVPTVFLFLA
jgi:16S rRNA (cytidine1402-2'-O)-methyltransferase